MDRAELLAALTPGPDRTEQVGVEVECGLLDPATGIGARYSGPRGVRAVLEAVLRHWGGEPETDAGRLTGVRLPDGSTVTLEHGGQIEYSSTPGPGLGKTMDEVRAALARLADLAAGFGLALVPGGNLPFGRLADVEWVPMSRGAIMRQYFADLGPDGARAPHVMALSLSTQVTLDFLGPEDLTRKLRMQTAAAPVVSALLVNSPLHEGRPCGLLSHRSWAWLRMDPRRAGLLPPALRPDVGAEDVVDWALGIPLIHYRTADGRYHRAPEGSFADLLRHGLADGSPPTPAHWASHLSQLWTDTRVRRTLELRGADGPPHPHLAALPALWTGLTYHRASCDAAWELTGGHTAAEHRAARAELPVRGLDTRLGGTPVRPLAAELLRLARAGLDARVAAGLEPPHVPGHLDPLDEIVATGRTFAEQGLARWDGELRRDPARWVAAHRI
ncbi:glutamate-cysteine ligase family protein [Kitasatospora cheerisanensis]|uniref:Glutamate--cysteine ligase n=1 Tax=Kitasatospora cheerisanensis KCTC 2395 TaxID=1348663 RepID=A0A066YQK3_9ACTN|nr:glutamate-cysteine ligase family protein [Kitasatospora cheerisanensis]KDN82254.1 glutamate-cysteine ligase [Kitasatospora cheerisanensis KCTC 2395]